MEISEIIGIVASILSSILYLPQLYHMIKRKSGKDISYFFLVLTILSSILWIVYGILDNLLPIILCDTFIMIITIVILIFKYYYENNA